MYRAGGRQVLAGALSRHAKTRHHPRVAPDRPRSWQAGTSLAGWHHEQNRELPHGERGRVAPFVTGRDLTADDKETLEQVRELARMHQDDLERQELDWGLTVPDALEHLLSGRADSPAEWAGNAYYTALQLVIDHSGSDISTLAS